MGVTLRHLLLHVSGFGYEWTTEELRDLVIRLTYPEDIFMFAYINASQYEPHGTVPTLLSGSTAAYNTPRLFESGTAWRYGCCTFSPFCLKGVHSFGLTSKLDSHRLGGPIH